MRSSPEAEREERSPGGRIAAVILAAGGSSRLRPAHKPLLSVGGTLLVCHAVRAARQGGLAPIVVVVGYRAAAVEAAVAHLEVRCVPNRSWKRGIASSIRAGIGALPEDSRGAAILLADMPRVGADHLRRLQAAFDPDGNGSICVPTYRGRRGNPVLWARRHFPALLRLRGDRGGRTLFVELHPLLREVPMTDDAVLGDLDTPQDLLREIGSARSAGDRPEKRERSEGDSPGRPPCSER